MIIPNMPAHEYHADPCEKPSLSASIAHILYSQSPLHAWLAHPKLNPNAAYDSNSRADLGTIAHRLFLEQSEANVVIVDADDWRTKEAKEARTQAWALGMEPILRGKMADVRNMVGALNEAIDKSELTGLMQQGKTEQTLIWQEDDTYFRSRMDYLSNDHDIIMDYKSTENANPEAFIRGPMKSLGYDIKAAFYLRAIKHETGKDASFLWIVQEVNPPYAVSFVGMGPTLYDLGRRKLEWTISKWRDCLATGNWHGYPNRICWAEAQSWQLSQIEEKEISDE